LFYFKKLRHWPWSYKLQYRQTSFFHHQACMYQVLFRSEISFLRYRAETKKVWNVCFIFRSCDIDLCPTILNINRLPPLTTWHVYTKFHLDQTFHSQDIVRKWLRRPEARTPFIILSAEFDFVATRLKISKILQYEERQIFIWIFIYLRL
jgi:hypothetical protein